MPALRRLHFWPLLAAAAPLLLAPSATFAQIPGLLKATQSKAAVPPKPEASESTEGTRARVRELLRQAREQSERPPQPVPAGIEPREADELGQARLKLVTVYNLQLRTLDQLDQSRPARQAAEARNRDWTGFEAPPPYSIFLVDQLRDDADVARVRIERLETGVTRLRLDSQRLQDELRRTEEAARRAEEAARTASAPADKARAAWRLDLARAKARAAAASVATASLIMQFRSDDLTARRAELALLERQIAVASQSMTFTEADVATARKRIDEQAVVVRRELAAVEAQAETRLRELDAARDALTRVRARAAATSAERAAAEARFDAAEAWTDSVREQSDALQGLLTLSGQTSALWGDRYTVVRGTDTEAKLTAAAKLREAVQRVASWKTYTETLVQEARGKLADIETELAGVDSAPTEVHYEQDALAARRGALLARQRMQDALDEAARQLDLWAADVEALKKQRDLHTRLTESWFVLRNGVGQAWNFELFSIEDTTVVDGLPITISRGVTVGKSLGAVLLFLLGYWGIAAIARSIQNRFVARGFDAAHVRTAKRWVVALLAILLLALTLNLARIPLTVFAFLGGALAIGVGFGTQTLIKNLVSGMVVLMERQVRVGDIVDVQNISGTVTEVNLRSSVVRGFDGVEAIVPNSLFLENMVTNWTRSDRRVRRVIKVGVAYESPAREVADLLEECARRHSVVLTDPAPLVIFEEFGDSNLVFALYVWLDLGPKTNTMQVLSDLRFMIRKRLAEAGITMAYPQRDLHLDAAKPLRVEVVRGQEVPDPG